jgi:eIF4-gamma/eIF5/eIF2-epsilon
LNFVISQFETPFVLRMTNNISFACCFARRDNQRSEQGPPPVLNSKFEKLADEERERKLEREGRRDRTSENDQGPLPVVNSRFAAVALADRSSSKPEDRGPPPVVNSRFAAVAEADRSLSKTDDHGPPPVVNSRFSAAAEADRSSLRSDDRGPPSVMNSRFAAAAEADRSTSYARSEDRGPPPIANSRFAAAAEADRSSNQYRDNVDLGPPPVINSRFSAAAEADGRSAFSRDDRGPPPVANSRFAAAAARADDEKMEFEDRRRERDNLYSREAGQNQRRALPQNSRFAAAAAGDSDYVDRDERERRVVNDRDRDVTSRDGRKAYDGGRYSRSIEEPPAPPVPTRVDELLKPKKHDGAVFVPITKEHEANTLKIPDKPLSKQEETFLAPSKKKAADALPKVEDHDDAIVANSSESAEDILTSFSCGEKRGEELRAWCLQLNLPPLEKLLFHMLKENEKLNPDPECGWAEPSNYGAALLALVEDNLDNQVQVLWAIQLYCESLGFPKLNGESVVQSMFRAMYKYDLAEADAFSLWKEDESDSHEKGKMTAIVQTMEWFNWLEAEDDEEGEDEEEEEEGVEY